MYRRLLTTILTSRTSTISTSHLSSLISSFRSYHSSTFIRFVSSENKLFDHNNNPDVRGNKNDNKTSSISSSQSADNNNHRSPTIGGPAATPADDKEAVDAILKAPFQKVSKPGLFPWRHSPEPLPRLIPGSSEYQEKGFLLGGDVISSNPNIDAIATAYLFLRVPWYNLLFFRRAWESDLCDSMSWAFTQAISGILSNTFELPFYRISYGEDSNVQFLHRYSDDSSAQDDKDEQIKEDFVSQEDVERMVHPELLKLFENAKEFGNASLQVRLEIKPVTDEQAKIVNLFVFPFLSRKTNANRRHKYKTMLEIMATSDNPRDSFKIIPDFLDDFQKDKVTESTVICQVQIPVDEIFYVKDVETGRLIQGHADEKFRRVVHLVRFEQVVKTHLLDSGGFLPFKHEPGNWQITDIDDLLEGNLLL